MAAEPDPLKREQRITDYLASLKPGDLPGVLAALKNAVPVEFARDLSRRVVRRWAGLSPTTVAAWLSQQPAGEQRQLAAESLALVWAGGDLAGTLERLAGLLERQRSLTAAIQSAMIYPCILVVAATGSIFLLLTRVLPQFVPLFAENGVALPPSTAFLLGLGNVISNYGVLGLVLTVAGVVGARMLLDRPGPRLAADALLLRLPVVGGLLRDVLAARFSRTLGTLLLNGVPLMAAMTTVKDIISNRVASEAVGRAVESAKNGQGISRALAAAAVFPVRMTQLLRLGEETAQLGPMALRAADMHEERTRIGLNRLVALLVPAITILMGAAVAGIVSSLLLAMLSLNDIAQ